MVLQVERAYDVTSHGTDVRTVRLGVSGTTVELSISGASIDTSVEDMRHLLKTLALDLEHLIANGEGADGIQGGSST